MRYANFQRIIALFRWTHQYDLSDYILHFDSIVINITLGKNVRIPIMDVEMNNHASRYAVFRLKVAVETTLGHVSTIRKSLSSYTSRFKMERTSILRVKIVKNIHVENIPRDSSTVGKNRANTIESRSINEISFVAFPRFPLVPKLLTIQRVGKYGVGGTDREIRYLFRCTYLDFCTHLRFYFVQQQVML